MSKRLGYGAVCAALAAVLVLEVATFAWRWQATPVHYAVVVERSGGDRFASLLRLFRRDEGAALDAAALEAALDPQCLDLASLALQLARLRPRLDVDTDAFLASLPPAQRERMLRLERRDHADKGRASFEQAVRGSWGVPQRCG